MKRFLKHIGLIGLVGLIGLIAYASHQNVNVGGADKQWAWNDIIGWINFHGPNNLNGVKVSGTELTGWATSSVGEIVLNCKTTPGGNVCSDSPFSVSNDGIGNLAGWAWSENIGWLSFCGNSSGGSTWNSTTNAWDCPASPTYQVEINDETASGAANNTFVGWAWNDIVGWIVFCLRRNNFPNPGDPGAFPIPGAEWHCPNPPSDFVQTNAGSSSTVAFIESIVFDTGTASSTFNSFLWRGNNINNGQVFFEFTTSDLPDNGGQPWDYKDDAGNQLSYQLNTPGQIQKLITNKDTVKKFSNKRYIKYLITLHSDSWQTYSPKIEDVIINWSP